VPRLTAHTAIGMLGRSGGHGDFNLEDIKPGLQVQVVAEMYFDRRVFLVANTGERRPIVIAITHHQARAIAADLERQSGTGEVHDRRTSVQAPVVVRQLNPTNLRQCVEGDVLP
jgi:hypothetical protein